MGRAGALPAGRAGALPGTRLLGFGGASGGFFSVLLYVGMRTETGVRSDKASGRFVGWPAVGLSVRGVDLSGSSAFSTNLVEGVVGLELCSAECLGTSLGGESIGLELDPFSSFNGGRNACTGGRNGDRPPVAGGMERILGRRFPVVPTAGRVCFGRGASGIGRSNSTGVGSGSDMSDCEDPNQARILTATSESTELEWVLVSSTPTSGNTARISLAFTSSSRANSLIRILGVRVKTAITPLRYLIHR